MNIEKAKAHERANLSYHLGDAFEVLKGLEVEAELLIVDPPRAGCGEKLLNHVHALEPEFLIYISCHPASMARDLRSLVEKNWTLVEMHPVDMFPQTSHLECLSLLRSNKGPKAANN